jgi:hypothetical protein
MAIAVVGEVGRERKLLPNGRCWCFLLVARMAAFSPFSPVQKADLERVLWVDTGPIRLASVSQLGDQVSFHISFLALYSSS